MILLIGGMGFIGLHTTLRLVEAGYPVVITQYATRRVPAALEPHLEKDVFVERLDVTDAYNLFDVMRRREIDSIINLMAPPARATTPAADYRLYTVGLQNVLEAARTFDVKRVCLGSSGSVYAGLPQGPFHEDAPLPIESRTMVEAFKKGMETHAFYYASRANLNVVSLRIGSIYGPLYYSMFNLASRMCHAALRDEEPDFSDRPNGALLESDASDWTYVKDVARGIQMLHTAEALNHRTYNVGSGQATNNRQIFDAVRGVIPEARCSALTPGGVDRNPAMDISRTNGDTGYEPEYDIGAGIREYIDWLRDNPQ